MFAVMCLGVLPVFSQQVTLKGTKGERITDDELIQKGTTVLYFLSPECPLCQSYSLTINELWKKYADKGIQMVGIIPGTEYSDLDISTFKHKYKLPIVLWRDEQLALTRKYHATVTPEVIVVNTKGKVYYQGRIDNWAYEVSKKRRVITEHNLNDALNSIVNKQPVTVTKTKAIGCFIE